MKNGQQDTESDAPRRFYETAAIARTDGGWRILLDGRTVKTPHRGDLLLPSAGLAEAIAREWNAQGVQIDRRSMLLTRLANTALDAVRGHEGEVAADVLAYAGRDLVCYRAEEPEELVTRQRMRWDPLLAWAGEHYGARLLATAGVMPVQQPAESIEALRIAMAALDAFQLTALHVMTTLTGSAVLALAHSAGRLSLEASWEAAHIDEDFQIERWGVDAEAKTRRASRYAEMYAASKFFALSQ